MTPNRSFLLLGALLVALAESSWGQKATNWRVYRAADGLAESACNSVTVDSHGKVWAVHANSAFVSELDGYTISAIPAPGMGGGRILESPGGQLWAVVPDGLQEFRDGAGGLYPG